MSQPVSVEVRDHRDHAVVTVTGEVVEDSVAMVRRTVEDVCAMYSRMVLDVGGASFPDNLGIREFLRIRERFAERNGSVRIVGMTEALRRRSQEPTPTPADAQQAEEAKLLAQVVQRVCRRFPSVEEEVVAGVVTNCYRQFDGTRIREFIPILVEREANDHFRALARQNAG